MMMPANYSVIAENEMTYVVGGGLIADVLPAIMTASNWKTLNTNLVKIVGNTFMKPVITSTLGVMFGGSWGEDDTMFGKTGTISGYYTPGEDTKVTATYVLNKIMGTIGGLASIYTLSQDSVKTYQSGNVVTILG